MSALILVFVLGVAVGILVAQHFAVPKMVRLLKEGVRLSGESQQIIEDLRQDNVRLRKWVSDVLPVMETLEEELMESKQ